MKKQLLFLLFISIFCASFGQKYYVRLGGGYSLATGNAPFERNQRDTVGGKSETLTLSQAGKGVSYSGAFGYYFNPNFGVELGVQYFKSSAQSSHFLYPDFFYTVNGHLTQSGTQIRVLPALVMKGSGNITPTARFGLILPVGGGSTSDLHIQKISATTSTTTHQVLKTEGSPSLGFTGGMGVEAKLGAVVICGELVYQGLSVGASKTTITEWLEDGKDVLATNKTFYKEIVYVDKLDKNSNNKDYNSTNYSEDKPEEKLRKYANYSNIGLQIGVKYAF